MHAHVHNIIYAYVDLLVLLSFNQLPQIEQLYRIGTVARTLTSRAVWDVKFSHEGYSGFGITLSKVVKNVVGEYGPASICESWLLQSMHVQQVWINTESM